MRNLWVSILLFVWIGAPAQAANWTYFFYISGDYYYNGLTPQKGGKFKDEDQAHRLFRELEKLAEQDKNNNYAIYFDSKGRPLLSNYQFFYEKGRRKAKSGAWSKDPDSTDPDTFGQFIKDALVSIPSIARDSQILFYYYGEGLSSQDYPFDHDLNRGQGSFTYRELTLGLDTFSYFNLDVSLLVLHSCFMNDLRFYQAIWPFAQEVILPQDAVSRSYLDLSFLKRKALSREALVSLLLDGAKQSVFPHPFVHFRQAQLKALGEVLSLVESGLDDLARKEFQELTTQARLASKESANSGTGLDRGMSLPQWSDELVVLARGDVLVTLRSYIEKVFQLAEFDEESLSKLSHLLQRFEDFVSTSKVSLPFGDGKM